MKLRPALLLCIGVLFATAPVWADKVPCCEIAKGSMIGISADFGHGFETSGKTSFFSFLSSREEFSFSREDRPADLGGLGFFERFTDHTKLGKGWFEGRDGDRNPHSDDPGPASVPEPGTLPLLLLGVSAVGIVGRKR